mgnify:CR=1 FL=1
MTDFHKMLASFYPRKQGNYREYAFLALGFPYSEAALKSYVQRALVEGEALACRFGVYYRLADAAGAEVWVRTRLMGQVSGVEVFFSGATSTLFGLENILIENDDDPLEGGFYGWSKAEQTGSDDPEDQFMGDFPTAFSVPDFARHIDLPLPALRPVQYAAFAKGLSAYTDEADFRLRSTMNMASRSFFPSAELQGWVTFAGQILDCGRRTNGISGQEFAWAAVEAFGATLDVVANPRTLRGTLVPGGYVMGHFWLMGRLL